MTPNWYVSGSVLLDLDRYLLARETYRHPIRRQSGDGHLQRRITSLMSPACRCGLGYIDECTTFSVELQRHPARHRR